jgi:hypothetical protein
MFSLALLLMSLEEVRQRAAVLDAIRDEIQYGIEATIAEDIDRYMEGVPQDLRILEEDGSVTDWDTLKARQLQAWTIITRTNLLEIDVTGLEVGCGGTCATARTDQRWDRQMLGKDGVTEFSIVTTQQHVETWEVRNSRWVQVGIEELGGTTVVDGRPY